jgi:hypothetical protein
MRKLAILAAVTAVALVGLTADGLSPSAEANGPVTLWQIGSFDGAVKARVGASEYPATDSFFPTFNYTASGIDLTPNFPGVISDTTLSAVLPPGDTRPLTDAAETVTIQFSVPFCDYDTATLHYDRYGSEADELSLDGTVFDTVSGVELRFQTFTFNLGPISAGSHQLKIVYKDGGVNNGHYIDALKFEVGDPQCIPRDICTAVEGELQGIVDSNPDTDLADKIEDALGYMATACDALTQAPPDNQSAIGAIEGAVGDLQAAVDAGLLGAVQGRDLMDRLAGAARLLAADALAQAQAIALPDDATVIAEAEQALADGDALRDSGAFKDAVNEYKDTLAKAESILP